MNLRYGHIAAVHRLFNRICQVASVCTPIKYSVPWPSSVFADYSVCTTQRNIQTTERVKEMRAIRPKNF